MNAKANGRARARGPARKKAPPNRGVNGAAAPPPQADGLAPVLCASELPLLDTAWLLPGFFPFGNITILEGRKDAGKSAFCCLLAAHVTGQTTLPGCKRRPARHVVWFAGEEYVPATTRRKWQAAGANEDLILCPGWHRSGRIETHFRFPTDLDRLDKLLGDYGAALVVLDPWESFVAPGLSIFDPVQCRQVLDPLFSLVARRGAACVCTRNLVKGAKGHAHDAGYGSGAVGNIARSVVRLDALPESDGLRALWRVAGNLSKPPAPLTLTLAECKGSVALAWQGEIDPEDPRLADAAYDAVDQDTLSDAKRYILDRLSEGRVPAQEMITKGKELGFSNDKLFRARKAVGGKSESEGNGAEKVWYWSL